MFGEGNGNPLQCSCLENPRDGGSVYGVAQSRTRLKRCSSSSKSCFPMPLDEVLEVRDLLRSQCMAYCTLYLVDHGVSVIAVDLEKVLKKLLDSQQQYFGLLQSGRDYNIIVLTFENFHSSGEETEGANICALKNRDRGTFHCRQYHPTLSGGQISVDLCFLSFFPFLSFLKAVKTQ